MGRKMSAMPEEWEEGRISGKPIATAATSATTTATDTTATADRSRISVDGLRS